VAQAVPYEDRETLSDVHSRLAVIEKYNKHSSVLMQSLPRDVHVNGITDRAAAAAPSSSTGDKGNLSTEYEELLYHPASKYQPLQLLGSHQPSNVYALDLSSSAAAAGSVSQDTDEPTESAFGVSSFRKVTKSSSFVHLPNSIAIQSATGQEELKKIQESIHVIWPTADRAHMTNQNVIMPALREAWQLQRHQMKQYQSNTFVTTDVSESLTKHSREMSDVSSTGQTQDADHIFRKNQASFLVVGLPVWSCPCCVEYIVFYIN
jgi:hypothetical protein